jgi:hypothetical protein
MRRALAVAILLLSGVGPGSPAELSARQFAGSGLQLRFEEPTEWGQVDGGGTTGSRNIGVVTRRSLRIIGTARHPLGVAEVLLNGQRASLDPQPDGTVRFIGYARTELREAAVEVAVVTGSGERIPSRLPVRHAEGGPPPASPIAAWESSTSEFRGKRWAVVIGVSEYRDPDIMPLRFADRDAKSFYDFLRSDLAGFGGFAPENIRILLNSDATYANIRVALFDFLKNATEDDVVYIYFAGHGAPDPDRLENLYLLPYDANSKQLGGTGFPMEDMNKALRQVAAKHKVLITDACHSGGVSAGTRSLNINQINQAFLSQAISSSGVHATFTASGPNQISQEGPQWGGGHGVFTHFMLEGLRGAADEDGDHIVSLGELMHWVKDRVRRETRNAQVPEIGPTAYDFNWPMSIVLPEAAIRNIPLEEIRQHAAVSSVMTSAYAVAWRPPDSLVTVVGVPDTLRIRLENDRLDVLPSHLLDWSSSNPSIVRVDASGVVHPEDAGSVMITAQGLGRSVSVPVRVLGRPSQVLFQPAGQALNLVVSEQVQIRSDILIGSDQWVRGMQPKIEIGDSAVIRREGPTGFRAERDGRTTLTATIGGQTHVWQVNIVPPGVRIVRSAKALLLRDSVRLEAQRTRPDGTQIGAAANVTWTVSDPARGAIVDGSLRALGLGRIDLTAQLGQATDSVSFFALGDLLVSTEGQGGRSIQTVSIESGEMYRLLPPDVQGWQPSLSPRGDQIVFVSNRDQRNGRIYIMNADGSDIRRLTPEMSGIAGVRLSSYVEQEPSWSHDGTRVVFVSNAYGSYEVVSMRPNGEDLQRLTESRSVDWQVSTAPDQPRIAFSRVTSSEEAHLILALLDGSQQMQITHSSRNGPRFVDGRPYLLPGGQQLLFTRRPTGRAGEALAVFDVSAGTQVRELVPPQRDHAVLFAVSPSGRRVAYHHLAEWGRKTSSIVVVGIEGEIEKTINLGSGVTISGITWGATPTIRTQEE